MERTLTPNELVLTFLLRLSVIQAYSFEIS